MTNYAIYRGDEFVFMGTADECAEEFNVKPQTIKWMTTPAAKRRYEKHKNYNGITAVKVEDDE